MSFFNLFHKTSQCSSFNFIISITIQLLICFCHIWHRINSITYLLDLMMFLSWKKNIANIICEICESLVTSLRGVLILQVDIKLFIYICLRFPFKKTKYFRYHVSLTLSWVLFYLFCCGNWLLWKSGSRVRVRTMFFQRSIYVYVANYFFIDFLNDWFTKKTIIYRIWVS